MLLVWISSKLAFGRVPWKVEVQHWYTRSSAVIKMVQHDTSIAHVACTAVIVAQYTKKGSTPVFTKIIGHVGHFRWLGPNVRWEIWRILIEYIKPIGQMSDESWKFFGYTATLTVVRLGIPSLFCYRTTWKPTYGCPLVKLRKLIKWIILDRPFISVWSNRKLRTFQKCKHIWPAVHSLLQILFVWVML